MCRSEESVKVSITYCMCVILPLLCTIYLLNNYNSVASLFILNIYLYYIIVNVVNVKLLEKQDVSNCEVKQNVLHQMS